MMNTKETASETSSGNILEKASENTLEKVSESALEKVSENALENASEKEKLHRLKGRKKLQYLWDYYKLHFAIGCVLLYILGSMLYGHFTQKDPVLYAAFINVAPGEALTEKLGSGFLASRGLDAKKQEFSLYTGLYLSSDEDNPYHEYTYASRIKLIAAIDSQTLDIVLLDQEAFDAFSQNGYLYNMETFLSETDPALYADCRDLMRENIVILEDNAGEASLDSSVPYSAETETYPGALEISRTPLLREAGFSDPVYLGVIRNTPRKEAAAEYIGYLCGKYGEK